jgi:hypothetical protein
MLGKLPVLAIDTALVLRVLEPIWQTKTETASRVRGRIEAVLDWAAAREFRQGENPLLEATRKPVAQAQGSSDDTTRHCLPGDRRLGDPAAAAGWYRRAH